MDRKRLIVLLVGLMAMCWMPMSALNVGDVNSDGEVSIKDVSALIDYLLDSEGSAVNRALADVNGDGEVSIKDVSVMIDYLLTGEWPYVPVAEEFTVNGVTFKMMPVKGGTFMMGATTETDNYARPWESPVHEVTLSDYSIGVTEVTQELWRAVMGSNPSWYTSTNGYENDFTRPVEKVSYDDCLSFISRLNRLTGRTFRLPTEAEWEFAARGGNRSQGYRYAGSDDVEEVAWHKGNSGDVPHSVGTKAPNELGLYDMSGNVDELTSDLYGLYSEVPQTNPTGAAEGTNRVARGGSFNQAFRACRVSCRLEAVPVFQNMDRGLRLAM